MYSPFPHNLPSHSRCEGQGEVVLVETLLLRVHHLLGAAQEAALDLADLLPHVAVEVHHAEGEQQEEEAEQDSQAGPGPWQGGHLATSATSGDL